MTIDPGGAHDRRTAWKAASAPGVEKSTHMYDEAEWTGDGTRHAPDVSESVRHWRDQASGIVRPRFEHQNAAQDERQMDVSLSRVGYELTKTNEQILSNWAQSQDHTFISFGLPFKPRDLVTNQVNQVPTVFEIARMTSRTYVGKSREFSGEHGNEKDRERDTSSYRKWHNVNAKGIPSYLEDLEPSQPYSINTVHLQNPYKAPQKLEGFAVRNSCVKVRSRFFQKAPHRTRETNFRSRNNNLATVRREISTVKVHDADDDKAVRSRSRRKEIRMYLKKLALAETAKQYCSNSSLHGLRYIGDATLTTLEKVFWLVAFIVAVASAGYFIQNLYHKWVDSPIIISISPEPVAFDEFPFPSVTICNMNNVKKSEAMRINKGDNDLDKLLLEDMCNFRNITTFGDDTLGAADWNNVKRFMINVSQPCTDMVKICKWHGNQTACEDIFNPTMTDEGLCCNFNSVPREHLFYNPLEWADLNLTYPGKQFDWSPETGYDPSVPPDALPWRPYGAGKYLGLTLVLDVDLNEYYCSSTHSVGFKMFLHNPVETPKIADFAFAVSPGRETRVVIKPSIASAQWSIQRVPKAKRRCFFTSERKLRYYRTYTQKNCLLECEANFTQKNCHCVQYYMPKSAKTAICGKKDDNCATSARRAMEYKLYDEDVTVGQVNLSEATSCNCWPGCFEMNYDSSMSSSELDATYDVEDLYVRSNEQQQFGDSIAIVHLYFVDSQFPNYVKSELFGFIEFLSSTGGLLGLFMGFSFLSVAEVVYFITLRIWCRLHGHHGSHNQTATNVLPANHDTKSVYPFAQ